MAEQITWQREAAVLLDKLLQLAAKNHLPAVSWTVSSYGAALHGECTAHPHPLRREHFTAWRDAITAASDCMPDADQEHTQPGGETRLVAQWPRLPLSVAPKPGFPPRVRVVLTASIWADDDEASGGDDQ
jgi:hypothetical protein